MKSARGTGYGPTAESVLSAFTPPDILAVCGPIPGCIVAQPQEAPFFPAITGLVLSRDFLEDWEARRFKTHGPMRALILSDIHANIDALDAVLNAAPEHDAVWNLGDTVGYGGAPNEVIERARGLGNTFVRGNHDRACSGQLTLENFNPVASCAARWTQRVLTDEHVEWLRHMTPGPVMPDGPQVSCMHGSYLDEDEYLFSVRDAWLPLRLARTRINFFGHTHVQGGFATNGDEWFNLDPAYSGGEESESVELKLRDGARYLINPGSVGQPRDGDWRAAFALYDDQRMLVEFHRVPYDLPMAQMRILRAGLPDRLATRLRQGR